MAYEIRENSGSMFKNDKKTADNHPNMTGKALIGGVEYWLSAWTKEGAKGKWQSLSFKPVDEAKTKAAPAVVGSGFDDMDDDIPF